jgi:hypothetical protein
MQERSVHTKTVALLVGVVITSTIAGGILGAMYPNTVNREWCNVVESINGHDLPAIASSDLARLRH